MADATTIEGRAEAALEPLRRSASRDYIGEPVSQLEHALQAATLAVQAGCSDDVVLAALFHDIGHLLDTGGEEMAGLGVVDHEYLGGEFLASLGFSDVVSHLVSSHVNAKRYLCYRKMGYLKQLSDASRQTLDWQGGAMERVEAEAFEADPWFEVILALRTYDERAKDSDAETLSVEDLRPTVIRHLHQQLKEGSNV